MSTSTTYLLSLPTNLDETEVKAAMEEMLLHMPHSAPFALIGLDDGGMLDDDLTFESSVPEDVPENGYRFEDGRVLFCASILNIHAESDDEAGTTRLDILVECLSALSTAPEGAILGGWYSEHMDHIGPVVQLGGRLRFAYSKGHAWESRAAPRDVGTTLPVSAIRTLGGHTVEIDPAIVRAALHQKA